MNASAIKHLRQFARDNFGPRRLRITRDGEVHLYSLMPNSIETGWWLVGSVHDACERFFGPDIAAMYYKEQA